MVPSNILQRTFHVKIENNTGTAFAIEKDGRQYLVSAAHVLSPIGNGKVLEIKNGGAWVPVKSHWVGRSVDPVDVAVVALEQQIAPTLPITVRGTKDVFVSGNLFFLGFPYGMETNSASLNTNFPLPLVKRALCAGFQSGSDGKTTGLYLDGINNIGFSGGPVIDSSSDPVSIVAVISGYQATKEPVIDGDGKIHSLYYQYNTGIIVTYDVEFALKVIEANPIGFKL